MARGRVIYVAGFFVLKGLCLTIALSALIAGGAYAGTSRIVALGDSLVHGFGLFQQDGLVPQLNRWLRQEGIDAEVVNAGVSGDTSTGGAARIDWALQDGADALIVLLGGNDLLRGIDPQESRRSLEKILTVATGMGIPVLLVGHEAPPNFGQDYKRQFEAIFTDLAAKHEVALFQRYFAPLDELGDRNEVRLKYMQDDGLHPNADGVAVIVEKLGPRVAELVAQ